MLDEILTQDIAKELFRRRKLLVVVSIIISSALAIFQISMSKLSLPGNVWILFILIYTLFITIVISIFFKKINREEERITGTRFILSDLEISEINTLGNKKSVNKNTGSFKKESRGINVSNGKVQFIIPHQISNFDAFLSDLI
ncbi:MAG: hypothetical protein GQ574_14560 [Crocinitomix sp.]|nr:hypothetical protein [Crocinitomix sp.]